MNVLNINNQPLIFFDEDLKSCCVAAMHILFNPEFKGSIDDFDDNTVYDFFHCDEHTTVEFWEIITKKDYTPKIVSMLDLPETSAQYIALKEGMYLVDSDPTTEDGRAIWEELFKQEEASNLVEGMESFKWNMLDQILGTGMVALTVKKIHVKDAIEDYKSAEFTTNKGYPVVVVATHCPFEDMGEIIAVEDKTIYIFTDGIYTPDKGCLDFSSVEGIIETKEGE